MFPNFKKVFSKSNVTSGHNAYWMLGTNLSARNSHLFLSSWNRSSDWRSTTLYLAESLVAPRAADLVSVCQSAPKSHNTEHRDWSELLRTVMRTVSVRAAHQKIGSTVESSETKELVVEVESSTESVLLAREGQISD